MKHSGFPISPFGHWALRCFSFSLLWLFYCGARGGVPVSRWNIYCVVDAVVDLPVERQRTFNCPLTTSQSLHVRKKKSNPRHRLWKWSDGSALFVFSPLLSLSFSLSVCLCVYFSFLTGRRVTAMRIHKKKMKKRKMKKEK